MKEEEEKKGRVTGSDRKMAMKETKMEWGRKGGQLGVKDNGVMSERRKVRKKYLIFKYNIIWYHHRGLLFQDLLR